MPAKPIIAQSSAMWLYQLIGAPLNALVKAEAQAASTTAEFIERYGFNPPEDPGASEVVVW